MKRLVILISILLIVSFAVNLILIFSRSKAENSQPVAKAEQTTEMVSRGWGQPADVNIAEVSRIGLREASLGQGAVELNFLRKVAAEEGAVKTIEMIDRLLARREERLKRVSERMERFRRAREEGRSRRRAEDERIRRELEERARQATKPQDVNAIGQ